LNGLLPTSELVVSAVSGTCFFFWRYDVRCRPPVKLDSRLRISHSCAKLLQNSTDPERDGGRQENEAKLPQRTAYPCAVVHFRKSSTDNHGSDAGGDN
jgi:hypothetical protein